MKEFGVSQGQISKVLKRLGITHKKEYDLYRVKWAQHYMVFKNKIEEIEIKVIEYNILMKVL